jgi:8-amino-7-oxononanoate synthase
VLPDKLNHKLKNRERENSLRKLGTPNTLIDFASNDYLGFSKNNIIFSYATEILKRDNLEANGATGSRLLSGNHKIYTETEKIIASFHNSEDALVFNSGYDANIGFFSSVPQRGDIIIFDELCHASIRDGIRMSNAKAFKFKHNDLKDLSKLLNKKINNSLLPGETSFGQRELVTPDQIYIITESIFSMDGDQPDLKAIASISQEYKCSLVVDEAHAVGVFGKKGEGLVQELGLEDAVFARIITFGKALGCHGAAILGSSELKEYLINFARSFIYTTGLPPNAVATIQAAYHELENGTTARELLKSNIAILQNEVNKNHLEIDFISSNSAIHSIVIPGNAQVKKVSEEIKTLGFDVKPILSPTVTEGRERLRICLHSYNTKDQIQQLVVSLGSYLKMKK